MLKEFPTLNPGELRNPNTKLLAMSKAGGAPSKMFMGNFMVCICDNKNVESRSMSVVKYVINNIMITALTGRRKTATYLHLVRELLYNIDWTSGR